MSPLLASRTKTSGLSVALFSSRRYLPRLRQRNHAPRRVPVECTAAVCILYTCVFFSGTMRLPNLAAFIEVCKIRAVVAAPAIRARMHNPRIESAGASRAGASSERAGPRPRCPRDCPLRAKPDSAAPACLSPVQQRESFFRFKCDRRIPRASWLRAWQNFSAKCRRCLRQSLPAPNVQRREVSRSAHRTTAKDHRSMHLAFSIWQSVSTTRGRTPLNPSPGALARSNS